MGTTTTFANLIDSASSEKIFLAELRLAEEVVTWTLTGGQTFTYETTYLNETITLVDATTEIIRKEVVSLELDGTAYVAKETIAEVEATSSSFWHDMTSSKLYVHPADGGSPIHHTLIAYFWFFLGTKGIILYHGPGIEWEAGVGWEPGVGWGLGYEGYYYEPYISDRGIPGISQQTADIFWGISQISIGSLVLLNNRGFFDQIFRKFIWTNKKIRILLGGDLLPYEEYAVIFTGQIIEKTFSQREINLQLRSNSFDLLRQMPVNNFWISNYPNLDPSAQGFPMPYYWGKYDSTQAPIVTCINTAYAGNTYQFKICDTSFHAIKAITQVYIDYGDGIGWQTIVHANEDLTNATFTITSATFVLGTSKIKVAFQGYHSGGTVIEGAPEIVEDLLLNACGYAAGDLNTTAFTASKTNSECVLNVFVKNDEAALSVIEKICRSDIAFFDEDGDGKLRYRTWAPETLGTIPVLAKEDILNSSLPEISEESGHLFWKVKIGYSYQDVIDKYIYVEEQNDPTNYRYEKREILSFETYLRTPIDATTICQRLILMLKEISPVLKINLKISQVQKTTGDKFKVTLARAPIETVGGYSERIFEVIGKELSCFPLILSLIGRDLMSFSSNVGFWMADTAPNWATATAQERDNSGFWCDANGYCLTSDLSSKNKSLWW